MKDRTARRTIGATVGALIIGGGGLAAGLTQHQKWWWRHHGTTTTVVAGSCSTAATGTANEWVCFNAGGAPARCSSPCAYSANIAFGSITAALAAASASDTVRMHDGAATDYAAQVVSATPPSPCPTVIGSATVEIPSITTSGSCISTQGLIVNTGSTHPATGWSSSGTNITMTNFSVHGQYASIGINSGSSVAWTGGEQGCSGCTPGLRDCNPPFNDSEPFLIGAVTTLSVTGVKFYPQNHTTGNTPPCSANGFHLEMIRIDTDANGITFSKDTFCPASGGACHDDTSTVFITRNGGVDPTNSPKNITFSQNRFGPDDNVPISGHTNVATCANYLWAYNTFRTAPSGLDNSIGGMSCTTFTTETWVGNLGARASFFTCDGTHIKNVWQDDHAYTCGTDTVIVTTRGDVGSLGLGGTDGFFIQSGSPAQDTADLTNCPATDPEGVTRPDAAEPLCDAGANEIP